MRKYGFIALFLAVMMSLSVTSANACQPGCDCNEMLPIIGNRADAKRVEGKSEARELIKQNDNSVGMTCFDRALMLTARLGGIFSDVSAMTSLPINNTSVFGTSSFPDFGASTKLVRGLDAVVSPVMQGHVTNFADSISHMLGATVAGYLNGFVNSAIDSFLTAISGPMGDLGGYVADINSYYTTLVSAMDLLGLAMPTAVITAVATINAAWSMINSMISGAVAAVTSAINSLVNSIVSMINSAVSSLMAAATPDGECSRIAQLWGNDYTPPAFATEFQSLMGAAIEKGMPYFTLYEMLNNSISGGGTDLLQEITNATNTTFITDALNDLTSGGLSAPGNIPSWKSFSVLPVSSTVDDVIGQM
ncbi:MAG: hypothetical protein H3C49_07500 [Alphaproteobacteria bacterium]|nr:hypothetical protein [Alphaproteobacteria bacterium]